MCLKIFNVVLQPVACDSFVSSTFSPCPRHLLSVQNQLQAAAFVSWAASLVEIFSPHPHPDPASPHAIPNPHPQPPMAKPWCQVIGNEVAVIHGGLPCLAQDDSAKPGDMIPVGTGQNLSLHHLQYSRGMSIHQFGYFEDDYWRCSKLRKPKLSSKLKWSCFGENNGVVAQFWETNPNPLEKFKLDDLKFCHDIIDELASRTWFLRQSLVFPTRVRQICGCSNAHVANLLSYWSSCGRFLSCLSMWRVVPTSWFRWKNHGTKARLVSEVGLWH